MADIVKPLKMETVTDVDFIPTEIDATEDLIAALGVAMGGTEACSIRKNASGQMEFKDVDYPTPVTLKDLISRVQWILSVTSNGTISNGVWLGRGELLPNTPTYRFTRPTRIIAFSWGNSTVNADFDLEFYKNGRATAKVYTYQARNLTGGYVTGLTLDFVAGDFLDVKYIDQGDNVSDFALDIVMQATG